MVTERAKGNGSGGLVHFFHVFIVYAMARKKSSAKRTIGSFKPLAILGALVFLWWLLPIVFQSGVRELSKQIQAPFWATLSALEDLQLYWMLKTTSKDELIKSLRDLLHTHNALEVELQKQAHYRTEVERLEALLLLPPLSDFEYRLARVYRRELTSWWDRLHINIGESEGVKNGMGVIYREGIVGKVIQTDAHRSVVELTSSPSFRIAARLENDYRPVTYQGTSQGAFSSPVGLGMHIPTDFQTNDFRPLKLVSSHLGGDFPDGLLIGTVSQLEPDGNGLFQTAKVQLPKNLHTLQEVAVLIPTLQ